MSAGIQGVEPIIAALLERLQAGLPAEVLVANADAADDTLIVEPAAYYDYVPPPEMLTVFPTVGIMEGPGVFEDDTGFTATGRYQLTVVAYVQSADQQELARQARRYARSVARVMTADRRMPPAWGLSEIRFMPGPTLADNIENPRTYLTWTAVTMTAKQDEE